MIFLHPLPSSMILPQAKWRHIIPHHPMLGCSCPSHPLPRLGCRILRHLCPIIIPHLLPNFTTPLPARLWPVFPCHPMMLVVRSPCHLKFDPTTPQHMRQSPRNHRLQNLSPWIPTTPNWVTVPIIQGWGPGFPALRDSAPGSPSMAVSHSAPCLCIIPGAVI